MTHSKMVTHCSKHTYHNCDIHRSTSPGRWIGILAAVLLAACGSDGGGQDGGGGTPGTMDMATSGADGGVGPVDCLPACPSGNVCANGACTPVPNSCPCPIESYCDLGSNACKVGCLGDAQCSKGRYCDTATRSCKVGCRVDGECQSPAGGVARCVSHTCATTCNAGNHQCGAACPANNDVATCGMSCSPCGTPPNATATCDGRACGFTCAAGYADCNNNAMDGCEHAVTPVDCYQDLDHDGYGNKMMKQSFPCGVCPTGWTPRADVFDCYDNSADVFPGQTKYFPKAYSGTNYDYNCNSMIEKEEGQYSKFSMGPCYIRFPTSTACGETVDLPICLPGNYEMFTRGCR